jgi:hypothetical protein
MAKKQKGFKDRIMKTKWRALRARGIEPPKDSEENRRRAREAHHGI